MRIKCLTINQPWAWAILAAGKRVENRSWTAGYRGPLAIHAGKSRDWMTSGLQALDRMGIHYPPPTRMDFGVVVGVCDLVDIVDKRGVAMDQARWADGPFCWVLSNVRALKSPIAMSGQQGLFEIDLDTKLGLAVPVGGTHARSAGGLFG